MKKLMIATLGLAVAGSVFGAPQVFDYKASVKHMYLKEVKVKTADFNGIVYQKYAKSASLKGYLIMDADGVTSKTINADTATAAAFDYGRNRGFLVVQNSKAESKVRAPKILPAVLDAKWVDTQLKKSHKASSGLAEGMLFVGGDSVAAVRTQLDVVDGAIADRGTAPTAPAARSPGMSAYADYVWSSVYLFGQFNGPNWFKTPVNESPFREFENDWDENLPEALKTGAATKWDDLGFVNFFHDTWMNGAGIGKYAVPTSTTGDLCCGLTTVTTSTIVLDTLTGNLKGGLFLCTENGIDAKHADYKWFDDSAWEDQFNCARLDIADTFEGDTWQNDMWNDGAVDQATTDVIYGSWSIKWNRKFYNAKGGVAKDLTEAEERAIVPAVNTLPLWGAIKGAALKLNKSANVYDGTEIFAKSAGSRFNLPVVTPQFATYYGLK